MRRFGPRQPTGFAGGRPAEDQRQTEEGSQRRPYLADVPRWRRRASLAAIRRRSSRRRRSSSACRGGAVFAVHIISGGDRSAASQVLLAVREIATLVIHRGLRRTDGRKMSFPPAAARSLRDRSGLPRPNPRHAAPGPTPPAQTPSSSPSRWRPRRLRRPAPPGLY
jgi:hypothetical protein